MNQVLIKDKKYSGQYVIVKDFDDHTVITHGDDPQDAYNRAIAAGYKEPVILFVPSKNMVQIY